MQFNHILTEEMYKHLILLRNKKMRFNHIFTEEMYNQHQLWIEDHNCGKRLKLINADLTGADLRYAKLSGAVLYNAKLSDADLFRADLNNADLRCANLNDANLCCANLSDADLNDANLCCADLSDVDLTDADLTGANLSDANIRFCKPDGIRIKRIDLPPYKVNILDNQILSIGCQQHHLDQWKSFSDYQIDRMDTDALQWWNTHKTTIFNFIEEQNNAI
jgi:hypothetical protein